MRSTYETFVALARCDIISRFHHIKAPTIILYGEKNPLREREGTLKHNLSNRRKVIMIGLGQSPPTEDSDPFVREERPFLKGK